MEDWWNSYYKRVMESKEKPWELNEEFLQFLCSEIVLDESYMREYVDFLVWGDLCEHQKMSIDFIIEMNKLGKIKWFQLAMNDKIQLSEELIEKHLNDMCRFNLLSWDLPIVQLFVKRDFSDDFIRRNYMYINWDGKFSSYMKDDRKKLKEKYSKVLKELGIV